MINDAHPLAVMGGGQVLNERQFLQHNQKNCVAPSPNPYFEYSDLTLSSARYPDWIN